MLKELSFTALSIYFWIINYMTVLPEYLFTLLVIALYLHEILCQNRSFLLSLTVMTKIKFLFELKLHN